MSDQIRVEPDDLQLSAVRVVGHAEELHARHVASDGRIGDAAAGAPVAAAAALATAVSKWQLDTTVLTGRLTNHGRGLDSAGSTFSQTESCNTADVAAVGAQGNTSRVL